MYVALYKAKGLIGNRLISWWDGSYSHGELVYYDKKEQATYGLSSSMRDGGVRAKKIVFKKDNWDFVDIKCLGIDAEEAFQKTKERQGLVKYDYLGISGFVARPIQEDPDKMFCTEWIATLLGWTQPWRLSPAPFTARLVDEVNRSEGNKNLSLNDKNMIANKTGIYVPHWAV